MIQEKRCTVYFAPTRNRRYFSLDAAIKAEAKAIILSSEKYKTEQSYTDEQGYYFFNDNPSAEKIFNRFCRFIKYQYKLYNKG